MKKKIFLLVPFAVAVVFASLCMIKKYAYNVEPVTFSDLQCADIGKADKLMIVAHPDDEVLWGGGHLMDEGYFVVCITDGRNKKRSEEFEKVISTSGNSGLILDYPDKIFWKRDNWSDVYEMIKCDLETILGYKEWKLIVTHNPNGEYGHQHHRMTSRAVTDVYNEICGPRPELYYFGKYYKKSDMEKIKNSLEKLSSAQLEFKESLEKIYGSQAVTIEKLKHMNDYEMWTIYEERDK